MSGGSCNYVCYKIKEELCGRMEDDNNEGSDSE